jgi:hypothetical protein
MPVKLTNLATSTIAGAINTSVTSLAISSGDADKFPALSSGEWFPLVVVDNAGNREIMRVTARDGATLTVVRGQEGTAGLSFANGSRCELRVTAAALAELQLANGARAVKQAAGTDDETVSTTSFVQEAIAAIKGEVTEALDTFEEVAEYITDATTGLPARMRNLAAGAALPTENQGPIWHPDFNSVMTWQTFSANGASYAGYASAMVGKPDYDGQPTARAGFLKLNGGSYSKSTYAALWNWAVHNGRVVALGSWTAGPFVFADNGDGTFKVPDTRAQFKRAWDDGRGVDSGRVFGSSQGSQNLAHNHTGTTDVQGNHTHSFNGFGPGSLIIASGPGINNGADSTSTAGAHSHSLNINNSGGTEARPLNTALLDVLKF